MAPRVMAVLVCLLDRAGEVVSKDRLLAVVWDGKIVSDEVLTNAICELRKAFGDRAREPRFIETIAKKGYRIIAPVSRCGPASPAAESPPDPVGDLGELGARRAWRLPAALAAGALVAALIGGLSSFPSGSAPVAPEVAPRMVVLHFDNLTGEPGLDWLRIGLAELMTTGLARSPRVRVAAREGVEAVSRTAESSGTADLSPAPLRSGADLFLLGDFAKAGDKIRISVRVQSSQGEEILLAEHVEGSGEQAIFEMVDQLTARVLTRLGLLRRGDKYLERELAAVTTSSAEAYRYYAEGLEKYYYNYDSAGAAEFYGRAVGIDPGFALALGKLVIVQLNLGRFDEADAYARRALEHVERLAGPERHYVTGNYYLLRERTFDQALEAYRRALDLDPRLFSARHNIGFIYFQLERYGEAIEYLEQLVADGMGFPGTHRLLALSYAALGKRDEEYQLLRDYVRRNPEKWVGYRNLAHYFIRWGRLDDARAALHRASALRSGELESEDCWQFRALEDRRGAGEVEPRLRASRPCGLRTSAVEWLYRGRVTEALSSLGQVLESGSSGRAGKDAARSLSAHVLLEAGLLGETLVQAKLAQLERSGNSAEWEGHFYASLAHAVDGRWSEAEQNARALRRLTESLPTEKEKRRWQHLRGRLALLRGDPATALEHLSRAVASLPPRGFPAVTQPPQHVPIWYSLAMAHLALGDDASAARWLERIVESTTERVGWPIPYVRSLYHLAAIHERRGEADQALLYFRRFVEYWGDGELDRGRVRQAEAKAVAIAESLGVRPKASLAALAGDETYVHLRDVKRVEFD